MNLYMLSLIGSLSCLVDGLRTTPKLQWKTIERFILVLWNFDQVFLAFTCDKYEFVLAKSPQNNSWSTTSYFEKDM